MIDSLGATRYTPHMTALRTFIEDTLPTAFPILGIHSYPSTDLTPEALTAFKAEVEEFWVERLSAFQKARTAWSRQYLMEESQNKSDPSELLVKLRAEFDSTFEEMLNGRRAEELARALPAVAAGDEIATAWFLRAVAIVRAYSPKLLS